MALDFTPHREPLCSSLSAVLIDNLLKIGPVFGTTDGSKEMLARMTSLFISVTMFPTTLAIDCGIYAGKELINRSIAPFAANPEIYRNDADRCREIAMKCLRGLAVFPAGILYRDIVSNHFLPETHHRAEQEGRGLIQPTGGLYQCWGDIRKPVDENGLQLIVEEARKQNKTISIAGAGFSQGKQIMPSGENSIHISMDSFNRVDVNAQNMTAIVGAGATWSQIQNEVDRHRLAVRVMQASNVFSVGGSLSVNCHGWDHIAGTLGNTVNWIRIVDPTGHIQKITPDDELFGYVLAGWGMFGIIVDAEIKLTNNEVLFDHSKEVEIDDYVNYFTEHVMNNPLVKMHLCRLSLTPGALLQTAIAQNYTSSTEKTVTDDLKDEPPRGTFMDRIMMQVVRNSPMARALWWKREMANLQQIKKSTRNEIMRPPINAVFATNSISRTEWLQEYFIPAEKLATFIKFLGSVLDDNDVALFNASIRFVKQDTHSLLGYATEGDRFAVVLFFSQSLNEKEIDKTQLWIRKVIDYLKEIKGTFYLSYGHFATKDQVRASYPKWKAAMEFKKTYDPEGIFSNGLYEDYFKE
ncbi:MAG: FAD-binding oxidoreductase [Chlamydiales bacterium]|nr:FAD-binding oxidoreductase [Chlamydiia bacterium]MCP5507563.1 FAD-binding oxidoreductase [Chlamydiales bacterium]